MIANYVLTMFINTGPILTIIIGPRLEDNEITIYWLAICIQQWSNNDCKYCANNVYKYWPNILYLYWTKVGEH